MTPCIVRYVGLDIHNRMVEACILDAQGKVVHRERFALNRQTLALFAEKPCDPRTTWRWRPPPTAGRWPTYCGRAELVG